MGVENAAKINASGLCFEDYIETLQSIAAEAESTGEEKVKISRFVCNSAVDMVDYLGVLGQQFSGRPGLRILTTKEGNLL